MFVFFLYKSHLHSPNWSELIVFFSFSKEQRQKDMEEDKREEIQQLIRKSKNEQSEYHLLYTHCMRVFSLFFLIQLFVL